MTDETTTKKTDSTADDFKLGVEIGKKTDEKEKTDEAEKEEKKDEKK